MNNYSISITDLAESDLEDIGDYIAYELKNSLAALNTIKGIRNAINSLIENPQRHELDEDLKLADLGIRKLYYKHYKIYYLIDNENSCILIIRILHMLVDSRYWLYKTFNL